MTDTDFDNSNDRKIIRKVSISQRWDEEFQIQVKRNAIKTGRSMTQLTIDALNILDRLIDCEGFLDMKPKIREDFIVKLFEKSVKMDNKIISGNIADERPSSRTQPGLTNERIEELLKNNPGRRFSTLEIAELLKVPQSTIRAYTRKLSLRDAQFVLIEGRPNFIYYLK